MLSYYKNTNGSAVVIRARNAQFGGGPVNKRSAMDWHGPVANTPMSAAEQHSHAGGRLRLVGRRPVCGSSRTRPGELEAPCIK